jgi:ABC-type multidrug transport system ATPase subunit
MASEHRPSFSATGDAVNFFGSPEELQAISQTIKTDDLSAPISSSSVSSTCMTVSFKNLSLQVPIPAKNGQPATTRHILKNVSGEFRPGRLVAIMGASGSGNQLDECCIQL